MSSTKKKRKLKKKAKFLIIILLLLTVVGSGGVYCYLNRDKLFSQPKKTEKKEVKKKEEPKEPKEYSAKLFMVGDCITHGGIYDAAKQSDGSFNFRPMLDTMRPIISKYDLAYYNQETILAGRDIGITFYPRFNSPQEVGDAFVEAGFNMVSLSSNHTMDRGEQGVLKNVEYWKKHDKVAVSGSWASAEERESSINTIYEVNGIKYAFISYTIWNNGLGTPAGKDFYNNEYSYEKAKNDISSVRDKADFVIIAMHWGTEYSFKVDYKQEEIAKELSELGVDLIIGAHPHVIQTAEYINDKKTFVIYSLGNFLSDQLDVDNYTGLAVEVTLNKVENIDGTVTRSVDDPKAEIVYTVTNDYAAASRFRVVPYPSLSNTWLPNYANLYEKYKNVVNERYPNLVSGLTYQQ